MMKHRAVLQKSLIGVLGYVKPAKAQEAWLCPVWTAFFRKMNRHQKDRKKTVQRQPALFHKIKHKKNLHKTHRRQACMVFNGNGSVRFTDTDLKHNTKANQEFEGKEAEFSAAVNHLTEPYFTC